MNLVGKLKRLYRKSSSAKDIGAKPQTHSRSVSENFGSAKSPTSLIQLGSNQGRVRYECVPNMTSFTGTGSLLRTLVSASTNIAKSLSTTTVPAYAIRSSLGKSALDLVSR